ncbi:AhpC/TSA family protein [Pedobacter hiemivivus]|uniref:AhpC/TSA family protein n=1 Tax=Pedobacter hiemivivus TaxID=2530454 RepID=A0A4U1FY47_9SPHI|nr:TlpA disulfide reductase family protein [Pedobacter hiemivivus]TKC54980.1 AhpC/TSA family protein [Pedobacter hiemivivus]
MKKNIITTILLMALGHTMVNAQKTVTIIGTVKGDLKGHAEVYVYGKDVKTDTAIIKDGSFKFVLPFTKPVAPAFYDEYDAKIKLGVSPLPILIDQPGTVYLKDVDIEKGLSSGKVSGIKSAEDFQSYNDELQQISDDIQKELKKKYGDNVNAKSPKYEDYVKDFMAMNTARENEVAKRFVKANPDAYTATYILARLEDSMNIGDLEELYNVLSKNMKASEIGKSIKEYIEGAKKSKVGQTVKDFTLNDAKDQPFSLSKLKGKYVIIDFWASWCGPCKASFPHMKELYNKYKGDQFEIYSISIDQSKSDWLKALKTLELPWLQTLDTKNISISSFAVSGVPTTFLIDPKGKILLREVGLDPSGKSPVEQKLAEIFGAK